MTTPIIATPEADALIVEGDVVDITPMSGSPMRLWQVTIAVDRVVAGSFTGSRFAFAVHSPSKSGLMLGGHYRVRATRSGDGYAVDPLQWLPRD